jgi:phage-related protein
MKPVEWLGTTRDELSQFPVDAKRALGRQLNRVQDGLMPEDFKPMPDVGKGTYEIRVRLEGAWRLMYVAKFPDAIYVLHVFQKKTQQTAPADIDMARKRYRSIGE